MRTIGGGGGQPDDQLAIRHLHVPDQGRSNVTRREGCDQPSTYVATRLVHFIGAEVGVIAMIAVVLFSPVKLGAANEMLRSRFMNCAAKFPEASKNRSARGSEPKPGSSTGSPD